jgi:hypothetical protein
MTPFLVPKLCWERTWRKTLGQGHSFQEKKKIAVILRCQLQEWLSASPRPPKMQQIEPENNFLEIFQNSLDALPAVA